VSESLQQVEQIAAFTALLVIHAGGHVKIPFETVENGLPAGHAVHMEWDDDNNLNFSIKSIEEIKEQQEADRIANAQQ
jgi:hypothetical protein